GGGTRHPPEEYPMADWRELIEVHLTAAFDLSQQAARHMLPRGRGIIDVGSVMCYEAGLNIPAYDAAKHALAGLTKSLAVSWSGRNIAADRGVCGAALTGLGAGRRVPQW